MNAIERLEALGFSDPDDFEQEFAEVVNALPDLLKLARTAKAANEAAYNDFPEEWRRLNYELKLALEPLFREDPS